jgi:hypothetical protein
MDKQPFKPKLMEFSYLLTLQPRVMNSNELAKIITIGNEKGITDRTIRRWFNHLQTHCFDYYHYLKYENLGLFAVYVLVTGEKELLNFLEGFPMHDYVAYFFDPRKSKDILLVRYLVPKKGIKKLKKYLGNCKARNAIEDYEIHYFSTPVIIYSPFHKIMDRHGNLDFSKIDENDHDFFLELLEKRRNERRKISLSKHIKQNPFILPVLLTQHREHWSSVKIWNDIKQRLGNDIWKYMRRIKKKTDMVGVRYVQRTLKQIYQYHMDDFVQQVRVEYDPIVLEKNAAAIFFMNFNNNISFLNFVRQLAKRSLMIYVYPPYKNSKYMFYVVTGHREMHDMMTDILGKHDNERLLFRSRKKFKDIWGRNLAKFKYEKNFDPLKAEWT